MDCYKIINDEEALIKFIEWLPDLKDNEVFYWSLFSRKKYFPSLIKSNDKTQLRRGTANKENLLHKIKQLEIPLGLYKLRDMDVPQESLVLYIMPNPRCMKKATELMGKKCWDLHRSNNFNLHQEAMSCIQQSKSYAYIVDFDIDTKDVDLSQIYNVLPKGTFDIVETRGGYHLLVHPTRASNCSDKQYYDFETSIKRLGKNWYKDICNIFPVDQSKDQMLPVIGCCQSTFTPKFITI